MKKEDIDLMRDMGLLCEDPDCEATHVDIETLPEVVFVEATK